jgi:hypothetical protein
MRIRTRLIPGVVGAVLVLAACSGTPTEESATEEPAEEASVDEPAVEEESTMATVAPAVAVEASEVFSVLIPYNAEGGELSAEGSVEAHWYQWDGFYVVLYRGFDAT